MANGVVPWFWAAQSFWLVKPKLVPSCGGGAHGCVGSCLDSFAHAHHVTEQPAPSVDDASAYPSDTLLERVAGQEERDRLNQDLHHEEDDQRRGVRARSFVVLEVVDAEARKELPHAIEETENADHQTDDGTLQVRWAQILHD